MIVKLSDYIMEQDVSTASCDDIYFEQLQAEIEVGNALMSAYAKQLAMIDYTSKYTMEADGTSDTAQRTSIFSKFWAGVKKVWKAICDWFARRIESIKRLFGKGSGTDPHAVDTLISNLEKLPEEAKANFRCPNTMLAKIDSFKNYTDIMGDELLPALDEYMEAASHFGYYADNYSTGEKIRDIEKKIKDAKAHFDSVDKKLGEYYDDKKNTSKGADMNYEETISTLKDIKSKFSDNLKAKLDKMKEIAKALSVKIDKLDNSMPDINDDINKANHEEAGKRTVASAYFNTSLKDVTAIVTDVQKKVDDDIADIEKGLKRVQEKWIQYKKDNAAKNAAYEKNSGKSSGAINRARLGDGYKDMTDDQLRLAQAHGYDIYSDA